MAFALGDAAWLTGLERNADVVNMHCYAPLFCNVNPGGMQWSINLIGYDAVTSFGSPAYFVQTMFSNNRGDVVLPATFDPLPQLDSEQIPKRLHAPAPHVVKPPPVLRSMTGSSPVSPGTRPAATSFSSWSTSRRTRSHWISTFRVFRRSRRRRAASSSPPIWLR